MKVAFYGHVRQCGGIREEIDARIREVLYGGQYVMGPMRKKLEALAEPADEQALLRARVSGQAVMASRDPNRREFGL